MVKNLIPNLQNTVKISRYTEIVGLDAPQPKHSIVPQK